MCGICGLLAPPGAAAPDLDAAAAMNAALRHRGPDEGSVDPFGACVLAHQRLCVLDLEHGHQPMVNESGDVVAVLNGELYNFPQLREELVARGHEVVGTGDTAVLPHLYEEHGPRFVERIEGMFALALWDARSKRLVLARDRLGKKPLVWTRLPGGTVAFASELKALVTLPGFRREVDLAALDAYLALGYVPGDRCAFGNVRKLAPGHLLVAEDGRERVERYWRLEPARLELSDEEWLERIRAEVRAAVRRRLLADVPLGALLSGGIDSSVVVAAMAQETGGAVKTFSVGFPDARYDERRYARQVAERYGTDHEELLVEPDATALLPRLAWAWDEPLGDSSALPTFLVCELARRRVTVALTGDGGDEAFAGYERYIAHTAAARVPPALARPVAPLLRALPGGRTEPRSAPFRAARFLALAGLPAGERYGKLMELFPRELRAQLWTAEVLAELDGVPNGREVLGAPPAAGVAGLQLLDAATYLPGDLLVKADIASMANSLELRSPLLDHRVVELALALPASLKTRGRTGKVALRRAFAADLPPEVAARGKKGFGVPVARWFRGELRDLAGDLLLGDSARGRGHFRPDAVEALLAEHAAGRADHGQRIWALVMLELWHELYAESARPPAEPEAATADAVV